MIYFISRVLFTLYLKACFGFEVKGRENIPERGPFIIVANHVSYGDPVVMGVAFNNVQVAFVAKKELFELPFVGGWLRSLGCISIKRWSGSSKPLKRSLKKIKEGSVLGMFPEGTRSFDGRLQKAQPGVGLIAAKTGAPIIPMYISGTEKALPRGAKMPRPCKVRATVGKAVNISDGLKVADRKMRYEMIGEKIMEAIAKLND